MPDTLAQRIKAKYPEYADIPDVELEAKIKAKYPGEYDDLPTTQTKTADQPGFLSRAGEGISAAYEGLKTTAKAADIFQPDVSAPAARQIASGLLDIGKEALSGHPLKAGARLVGVNPEHLVEDYRAGNYGAMVGDIAVPAAMGVAAKFAPKSVGVKPLSRLTPEAQRAVTFGLDEGVPVDAATASGNRFVKNVQAGAANTPLGSMVAEGANTRQAAAMTSTGERLAGRTSAVPITPEQAGQGMTAAVTQRVREFKAAADDAYGRLRAIEAQPANSTMIPGAPVTTTSPIVDASGYPITSTTTPTTSMQAAVDLRAVKTALKPVYERMMRQMPLAQRQASPGLQALENIINGPNMAALSDADAGLSAIKSIARSDLPEARSVSQGLAASAVARLESAVTSKATSLGPDAIKALREGRAATIAKYAANDVLDTLKAEPVRTYGQAVTPRDAGIVNLRQVVKLAPDSARQIGRAWLDTALDKATAEGGFDRAQGLWADWQRLGPQTKEIIFGSSLTSDLDKFFLLGKKLAEQPNPSKTALTLVSVGSGGLLFTEPLTGAAITIGSAALAKALYSPRFVRALTRGASMPIKNGRAAIAAANELMSAAKAAGAPVGQDQP